MTDWELTNPLKFEHGQHAPLRNPRFGIKAETLYPAHQQQNKDDYQ